MEVEHPQYGKFTLVDNPQQDHVKLWWDGVIERTFAPIELPTDTITMLHDFFSSGQAYEVYRDTVPLLKKLQQDNIPMAIISNSDVRSLKVLDSLNLLQFFDGNVFLSCDTGLEKPDSRVFQFVESEFRKKGLSHGQIWHVGDDPRKDSMAAANVPGWKGILIDRSDSGTANTEPSPNQVVVRDLREVAELYR